MAHSDLKKIIKISPMKNKTYSQNYFNVEQPTLQINKSKISLQGNFINDLKNSQKEDQLELSIAHLNKLFQLVVLLLFFSMAVPVFGQVNYSAVRTTGVAFTSIATTGLSLAGWRSGTSTDDNLSNSTAIGFNFFYDGANRTTFSVSTNGFITFNTGTTATGTGLGAYGYSNPNFSTSGGTVCAIAPMYDDLVTAGNPGTAASLAASIRYQLTGTSPNRILTIEWKGMEVYGNIGPNLNLQIKLYETTNKIDFVYGTMTASTASYSYTSGVNSLTISSPPLATQLYTQQIANSATFSNVASNLLATIPASNSKITFTPNSSCTGTPIAGTATSAPATFCSSGSTTVTLTGSSTGVSGISYQWQNSTNGGATWNSISGATSVNYTTPIVYLSNKYRCVVTCTASGLSSISSEALFTNTAPTGTISPSSAVVCSPATSAALNVTTSASSPTFQWQLNGAAITGATSPTYSATVSGAYNVLITSGGCSATVSSSIISINISPLVTAAVSPTAACEGAPLNFSATAAVTDTNYSVSAIPYSKEFPSGGTSELSTNGINNSVTNFTGNMDDGYWSGISLPFNFNYYGANYTSLAISTNGNVQFGTALTTTWLISPAPTAGVPDNYIGAPWVDMDHSSITIGNKIEYFTSGISPNRKFVINWYAPLFGSVDNDTSQLVLFEGSNNIIVNLVAFANTAHQKTLGIENATGTIATVAPGRNGTYWQTSVNESWLFKRGSVSYSWTGPASFSSVIPNPVILSSVAANSGSYTVTVTDPAGCTGSSLVNAVINTQPVITCPANITVIPPAGSCNAVVTYTATATGIPTPVITYSVNSGSVFNPGTQTITATATNSCGSSTCSFTVTVVAGSTNSWVGGVSNDWFNASNWCSGIPTATTDVQISAGSVYMPVINTSGAICKNLTINSGGNLTMSSGSYLNVKGNWNNSGTFNAIGGVVSFNGSSLQTLIGVSSFYELVLNNTSGLTLNASSNISINNLLQLINGVLTTSSSIVTISNGSALARTNGYINGNLKKYFDLGSYSSQSFEIGSSSAYTPVSIYFNQVLTAGYLTINTVSTDHPSISTSGFNSSKTVNRYWNIVNGGLNFDYYNLDITYASADKDMGFVEMYEGVKIYSTSGTWSEHLVNYSSTDFISLENITTFGCVQIGVFNPVPLAFSLSPDNGYIGNTSNVIFTGKGFISGVSSVNSVAGVTINSTTVNNDSTLTLNVSISSSALLGTRKFAITNIANALGLGGTSDSLMFTIKGNPVANFYANRTSIRCNISGNTEFYNYSTNGSSYFWDFGAGASPATATGNGPFTVTYASTGLKTVKLIAFSPIGNDTLIKTNYINVTALAPAVPASITGNKNIACTSGAVTGVYTAPLLPDVTYNWTVPAGVTITSGAGTRTIIVSFSTSFLSGTISLTESNGCGTSAAKSITVTKAPVAPASISGSTIVCGLTSATYSIAASAGATSYTWTLPAGITSPAGVSPITITGTSLAVNFSSTFVSGNISVKANNACLSSSAKTLAVRKVPPVPGAITGSTNICSLIAATYSIAAVTGATSYVWTAPVGVTILTGQGTPSITVSIVINVGSGNLSVVSSNSCGISTPKTLALAGCHSYSSSSINDSINQETIVTKLYPNPSLGNFTIEYYSDTNSQLILEMFDVQGKKALYKILEISKGLNAFNFNEEEITKGVYFIRLIDEKNKILETKKLVIN